MVSPNVAQDLTPRGDAVFLPQTGAGGWPLLRGYVADVDTAYANLTVSARLWSQQGRLLWVRTMTAQSGGYYQYQTIGPGTSETKQWVFGSGVSGGTWRFSYHDVWTDPIPYGFGSSGAARARQALENHPDFQAGQITASFSGRTLTVTFTGDRAGLNIDSMSIVNYLTGSGDLSVTGSTTTNGTGDFPTTDGGRGRFAWEMVAFDGTTYAGGTTVQRQADAPPRAAFWIDDAPVLAMSFPASDTTATVGGTAVPFSWTVSNLGKVGVAQTDLNIVNDATDETVDIDQFGSWVSTDPKVRAYRLPYGRITGNDTLWRWNLRVTAQSGKTADRYGTIRLFYAAPPKPTAVTATLGGRGNAEWCDLVWTVDTDAAFVDQLIRVRPAGTASRGPDDRVVMQLTTPPPDAMPTGDRLLEYALNEDQVVSISQRAVRSGQVVESDPAEVTIRPDADKIFISEREKPRRILCINAHDGRSIRPVRDREYLDILNLVDPIVVNAGVGKPREFSVAGRLEPNNRDQQRTEWRLAESFDDNERQKTFLYRDALGQVRTVTVDQVELDHGPGDPAPTCTIVLRTIHVKDIDLDAAVGP